MARRYLRWLVPALLAAGALVYFFAFPEHDSAPGQPAPHAIDQSQ